MQSYEKKCIQQEADIKTQNREEKNWRSKLMQVG